VTAVPLALSVTIPLCGWRSAFVFAAVLGASAFLMSLPVKMPYHPARSQKISLFLAGVVRVLFSRTIIGLFAVRILVAIIIFGVMYPHLSLLVVQKLSFPPETVGPMFSLYAFGMFLGSLALPRMARRLPESLLGILGGAMLLCAVALLASASSLAAIGTGLLCIGAGSGILITQDTAHVSMAATPETHGTTMSAYSTIFRLGQSIAPGMMGCIYAAGGFSGLFTSAAVLAVVTGIVSSLAFCHASRQEALH
ncbi:MAG: MFS transporter, partial [Desulfovibrio sp.]